MQSPIPAPAPAATTRSPERTRKRTHRSEEEIAAENRARIERRMARIFRYAATLSPIGSRYQGITEGALLPQFLQTQRNQQGGVRCRMS